MHGTTNIKLAALFNSSPLPPPPNILEERVTCKSFHYFIPTDQLSLQGKPIYIASLTAMVLVPGLPCLYRISNFFGN